jgi:hypothetical protein
MRRRTPIVRTLAITQNITVDGSIEMLGDWFDPQGQAGVDNSAWIHRSANAVAGFLTRSGHGVRMLARA